jgi:hypothetical protein
MVFNELIETLASFYSDIATPIRRKVQQNITASALLNTSTEVLEVVDVG